MLVTWDKLEEYTKSLGQAIISSSEKFDTLVIIASSGMPTGLLLSKMLGIKDICFLKISRYKGDEKLEYCQTESYLSDIRDKGILIVDDICSSGETLEKAKELVSKEGPAFIKTATSVVSARVCKKYPDYFGAAITREENDWISFPWDKYEK